MASSSFPPVEGGDKYRSFMYGEGEKNTVWRDGAPPNYDLVNKLFEEGRTKEWAVGSMEEKVQRLLKSYEMEIMHKARPEDFKTIDGDKFTIAVNGRKGLTLKEVGEIRGSYNTFLQTSLPTELRVYDPEKETKESSFGMFKMVFPRGFAIEVLEVYSSLPPQIAFKFRHWGYMEGPFMGHSPTGDLVELFGICIFQVSEETKKIEKAEFFYERGDFLSGFLKGMPMSQETMAALSGCPFMS